MAARSGSLASKVFEKYYYDFSLYKLLGLENRMTWQNYVALRHNLTLVGGFYFLVGAAFPFKAPFPTMGMCPNGWDGTFVCEPDNHKAFEMYKDWKAGKGKAPSKMPEPLQEAVEKMEKMAPHH